MSDINREELGEWLSSYLDGELNREQEELIERRLREDESARRLLEELRRTADLVSSLPRHRAPTSISEDAMLHVERSELLGEPDAPQERLGGRRSPIFALVSMAAAICLLAIGLPFLIGDREPDTPLRQERLALAPEKSTDIEAGELGDVKMVSRLKDRRETSRTRRERTGIASTAAKSDERSSLLATADIGRKFGAGLGAASVRTHAFANETVRLKVTVQNEVQRDAVTERLTAYLAERHAVNLSDKMPDDAGKAAPAGSFYYPGDPSTNFTETNQRQILMRASRRELDGMMDELARVAPASDSVALVAGPFSIRGLERARTALYGFEEPVPAVATRRIVGDRREAEAIERDEAAWASPGQPPARKDDLFDGLFEAIGLDPKILSLAPTRESDADTADAETQELPDLTGTAIADAGEPETRMAEQAAWEDMRIHGKEGKRKRSAPAPAERPSLVDRRKKALDESWRRRDKLANVPESTAEEAPTYRAETEARDARPAGGLVVDRSTEPYVTLVVQVIVAGPDNGKPAPAVRRAKPTSGAKDKKRGSSQDER